MGSRLGMGLPKAMLEIAGKPLIHHHLDQLRDVEDVRIVVGYESQKLIDLVRAVRRDVIFVFNHEFRTTHTLASLELGARHGHALIVSLDGDLLVHPRDLRRVLELDRPVLGYCAPYTEDPVYCRVVEEAGRELVTGFSRERGEWEWTGLAVIERDKLTASPRYVFELLEQHLPYEAVRVECREIDTPADLTLAREWAERVFADGQERS